MQLIKTGDAKSPRPDNSTPPPGYEQQRAYRELDQLLCQVLQLDELRDHHCGCGRGKMCTCNSDKLVQLKQRIWQAQKKLDRLYHKIECSEPVEKR